MLGRHLDRALAEGTLRVDALCVTSESLVNALETQLIGVRARRDRLREFHVRLLLCDFAATPTYPGWWSTRPTAGRWTGCAGSGPTRSTP
ncbi:hypothetical protein ACFQZC_15765 [Streptacidiphilus monticola]